MKFGVVVFPGSTCERDAYEFVRRVLEQPVDYIWHQDDKLPSDIDCVILPGGFSYGDYLRPGAISSKARIMDDVIEFARGGGLVIGICNGFQILIETGLLPGALIQNSKLKFISKTLGVRVENTDTPFTGEIRTDEVLDLPVAHGDGNYYIGAEGLEELKKNHQILFRYAEDAPNGSVDDIAGITNIEGNVLGMMPHPERAGEELLGSKDGRKIFESILRYWEAV